MITAVSFSNFKDRSGSLALSPLTALIGPVGSGKSSIIEMVRLCLGLPTRHGSTGLDALSSTGCWEGSVTIRGHRVGRMQAPGRASLTYDGAVVNATDFKVKLAVATGVGVVPDVDLGEFLAKSGQERAALFGRLLANEQVSMEAAVKGATGMGIAEYVKAETGRDVTSIPWASVKGTPSEIVDAVKGLISDLKAKARDCEAHLRELLTKPAPETQDLGMLQGKLGECNQRLGQIKSKIENMESSLAAKRAASASLESLETRIADLKSRADHCEAGLCGKLAEIEQVKASVTAIQAKLDKAVAEGEEKNQEIAELVTQKREVAPGDPLAGLDMENLGHPPVSDTHKFASKYGIPLDQMSQCRIDLLEMVIKPWILASRELCKAASEAHAREQEALAKRIEALRKSWTSSVREVEEHRKSLNTTTNHVATLTRDVEDNRRNIVDWRKQAEQASDSRVNLIAEAQKVVVFEDEEVLKAEAQAKAAEAVVLGDQIRAAQKADQIKGQIDRAQFEHMQADAVAKAVQSLLGRLQEWRDRLTKNAMDAILTPFRQAIGLVLPGADVDIRIGGSGRTTQFEFTLVRDGAGVRLDHLSAGETALVGAAFLSAMHSLMESKAKLLTIDAEALDEPSLARLMEALPRLGFEFCLLASNRLRPDQVPEGWACHNCEVESETEATA